MKPIKQRVYVREIHHYDWLVKSHNDDLIDHVKQSEGYFFTSEQLNKYTQNVIKQALETAAEKSLVIEKCNNYHTGERLWEDKQNEIYITVYNNNSFDEHHCVSVDEESITNTFEETFKKFEV